MSEAKKPFRFLRSFASHNCHAVSYARFPYEQFKEFKKFIEKSNKYSYTHGLDRTELMGTFCVRNDGYGYGGGWMAVRRFNGEGFWNITNIASSYYQDFSNEDIIKFLDKIKEKTNIDLVLPAKDREYIEPTNTLTQDKYGEECNGFGMTSNFHISKVEKREKRWLEEEKEKEKKEKEEAEKEKEQS